MRGNHMVSVTSVFSGCSAGGGWVGKLPTFQGQKANRLYDLRPASCPLGISFPSRTMGWDKSLLEDLFKSPFGKLRPRFMIVI